MSVEDQSDFICNLVTLSVLIVNIASVVPLEWAGGYSQGGFPHDAVSVGRTQGDALYVCRAYHENNLLPGKLHPRYNTCYIPWNGGELKIQDNYDVAAGYASWTSTSGSNIPSGAFLAGHDQDESVYACRAVLHGSMQPGKFRPSHSGCYISYNYQEYKLDRFEVLVD